MTGVFAACRDRRVGALVLVTLAQAPDISGTWQFTVELDLGGGRPTFVFEQDGESLSGRSKAPSARPTSAEPSKATTSSSGLSCRGPKPRTPELLTATR